MITVDVTNQFRGRRSTIMEFKKELEIWLAFGTPIGPVG
jgi:hypothetical protein